MKYRLILIRKVLLMLNTNFGNNTIFLMYMLIIINKILKRLTDAATQELTLQRENLLKLITKCIDVHAN